VNAAPNRGAARWPVIIVISFFILITIIFVIAFVITTGSEMAAASQPTDALTADTYVEQVAGLLQNADADNGAQLVEAYGCIACHRLGVSSRVAPAFEGIAERAATRRPPLTAADYLYESIINPTAYVVVGYQPAMPQNYPDRLSDQELGDIIAYLLTSTAH
jgi:mono/diheme cytochrome c family protein